MQQREVLTYVAMNRLERVNRSSAVTTATEGEIVMNNAKRSDKPHKQKKSNKPKKSKSSSRKPPAPPVLRRVRVVDIHVLKDAKFRALNEEKVDELAGSIGEVGLMHPPTVYIKKPTEGEVGTEKVYLVAGRHRLAAVKKLGWESVDVIVVERSKEKNRKRYLTENLHRNKLTKPEEIEFTTEWVNRCVAEGGRGAHPQPHDKGISRAAKKLGMSPRNVRRYLAAGRVEPAVLALLKDAGLASNGKVLEVVGNEKPEKQTAKVRQIVRQREAKKAAKEAGKAKDNGRGNEPDTESDEESSDTPFDTLMEAWNDAADFRTAWNDADDDDRDRFIDEVLLTDDGGDDDDKRDGDGYGPGMTAHLDS
jgi:ParB family chromosome partitioning protein